MDKFLNKYAELVVRTGVNLQPQQLLVINSPIECSDFAHRVAEAAFEAGAKDVKVIWSDERLARIRLDKAEADFSPESGEERAGESGSGSRAGKAEPGTVLAVAKDHFTVQTGDGVLQVYELQIPGKKRMETGAFLRGYALEEGTVFTRE